MTDTTAPTTVDTVSRYVKFWNAAPGEQRRTGHEVFAPNATYTGQIGVLTGVDALADFTEQFVNAMGAYRFGTRAEPDTHHDYVRLAWELQSGDTSFAEGTDVLTLDEAGLITSVVTFVDRAPDVEPHHEEPHHEAS